MNWFADTEFAYNHLQLCTLSIFRERIYKMIWKNQRNKSPLNNNNNRLLIANVGPNQEKGFRWKCQDSKTQGYFKVGSCSGEKAEKRQSSLKILHLGV